MDAARVKRRLSDRGLFGIELEPGRLMRVYPPEGVEKVNRGKVLDALRAAGEDVDNFAIISSFLENAVLIMEEKGRVKDG